MKKIFLSGLFSFFMVSFSYTQYTPTPANLTEATLVLQKDCPDSMKTVIGKTPYDSLLSICYPYNKAYTTIYDWTTLKNENSAIRKYLVDQGVGYNRNQQMVIFAAFKHVLAGEILDEAAVLKPFQVLEKKWAHEDSIRFTTDSLRGIYIPKDLEDCYKQIDLIWNDSSQRVIKKLHEDDFVYKSHTVMGPWIKQNWLRSGPGSRLSKYFNDAGINHPDYMSDIIFLGYHRHLFKKEIPLEDLVKYYREHWKVQ